MSTEANVEDDNENDVWVQRWDNCDDCGCSTLIIKDDDDGVPDVEEWDRQQCLVCGCWNLTFGNADQITTDAGWVARVQVIREQRDQARRFAVACEGEAARLEAERDDLILRLERALAELSQVKDAAGDEAS